MTPPMRLRLPELAIITHIALDHTRILGPAIKDIAQAKAGIIKPGSQAVILAPHQEPAAFQEILKKDAGMPGELFGQ